MTDWISVSDRFPTFEDGNILIFYTDENNEPIIEMGYLCGERLIKGTTDRYPYPSHWMPLPKPPVTKSGHFFPEDDSYQ